MLKLIARGGMSHNVNIYQYLIFFPTFFAEGVLFHLLHRLAFPFHHQEGGADGSQWIPMDPNGSQWIPAKRNVTIFATPHVFHWLYSHRYIYIYIYRWLVLYSPCWSNQIYGHSGSLTQKSTLAVWLCCSFQAAEENSMLSSLFDELLGGSTIWIDDDWWLIPAIKMAIHRGGGSDMIRWWILLPSFPRANIAVLSSGFPGWNAGRMTPPTWIPVRWWAKWEAVVTHPLSHWWPWRWDGIELSH